MNLSERQRIWAFAGLGLICFVLVLTLEIVTEGDEVSLFDIAVDALGLLLTIGSAVGIGFVALRMQSQHAEKIALIRDLTTARAEGNGQRSAVRSRLARLNGGMGTQFQQWGMSEAEHEVGVLLLKGLRTKEIAALRATTEATVRQQAQSICRKGAVRLMRSSLQNTRSRDAQAAS